MTSRPARGSAVSRLSMMMFLQYAVWGIWLPYLANYLQQPTVPQAIAAVTSDLDGMRSGLDAPADDLVGVDAAAVRPLIDAALAAAAGAVDADGKASDSGRATLAERLTELVAALESSGNTALAAAIDGERSNIEFANAGLGFTGAQIGWILGLAGSIGALAAPLIAGQVADRFLNAEVALGLLLITGGIVKFFTAYATTYETFLGLSILYSILYMPTLALTNSVAFAHLDDAETSFPRVRTWGTIGWIVASNAFPLIWLQTNLHGTALPPFLAGDPKPDSMALIADCLKVSGVLAVGYGLWAMLALPKTPPKRENVSGPFAFVEAFGLLRHPGFLVASLAALPIAMIHQVYFIRTGPYLESIGFEAAEIGPVMSIGQLSEIGFLAILGLFLKRLGYRAVLALGCLAYAARYGLFALATDASLQSEWIAGSAMVLHGLCYGFFFAGCYVYIERIAPSDIRHSVQTVFGIIILGAGPVLAGFYNARLDVLFVSPEGTDYTGIWGVQAAIGLVCAIAVAAVFRPGLPPSAEGVEPAAHEVMEAGGSPPID